MTRDEILKMEAGRELDALIAEKIFKCNIKKSNGFYYCMDKTPPMHMPEHGDWDFGWIWEYSTDIAAAWKVVEKLGDTFSSLENEWHDEGWLCILIADTQSHEIINQADTAPLAICRAALLAMAED